jgi:hypothetical protein
MPHGTQEVVSCHSTSVPAATFLADSGYGRRSWPNSSVVCELLRSAATHLRPHFNCLLKASVAALAGSRALNQRNDMQQKR